MFKMRQKNYYLQPEAVDKMCTLYEILMHANAHYSEKIAYRQVNGKENDITITFSELTRQVNAIRAALIERGLSGKHIAIIGETCIEWISTYLAVVSGVGIAVPIDRELPPQTIVKQLDGADVDVIFCTAKAFSKLSKTISLCDSFPSVIMMRESDVLESDFIKSSFETLYREGTVLTHEGKYLDIAIKPEDACLIIYTSGTTGENKGVVLSNRNIMGTLRGCARLLHYPSKSFSVLPVNHSYELHAHLMSCIYCGTEVVINDDLKHLLKNLERFSPEMSCMVPMMLDLIVRRLKKEIQDSGKSVAFRRSVFISKVVRKAGIDMRRVLFRQLLEPLGGNLRMIICGGATLLQETVDYLDQIGIQIYNGYGITECSPVVAVNPYLKARKYSVGHILPTIDVRIANPDENGNGEIQLRGDIVVFTVSIGHKSAPTMPLNNLIGRFGIGQ